MYSKKILCCYCDASVKGNKACGGVVLKYAEETKARTYATFPLVKRTSHKAEVDVIYYATEVLLNRVWPLWFDLEDHHRIYIYNDNNIAVRQVNGHNSKEEVTKNRIQEIKNNLTLISQKCIISVRCRAQKSAFSMYSAHYFARNHIDEKRVLVYSI